MLLSNRTSTSKTRWGKTNAKPLLLTVGVGALLLLFALLALPKIRAFWRIAFPNNATPNYIYCDAEAVNDGKFVGGGHIFNGGGTQSKDKARGGNHSSKLTPKNLYGMTYVMEYPNAGDRYTASVWRHQSQPGIAMLAVSGSEGSNFYFQDGEAVEKGDDGWEKLQISFVVPTSHTPEQIKIFPYLSAKEGIAYFDDLTIEKLTDASKVAPFKVPEIKLELSETALLKIERKRQAALHAGLLISEDADWVKGKINTQNEKLPIKLRLKGDWLDHLQGKKWSFRIKVNDPYAWNRLVTFSIQTPLAREYLKEWVFHQILKREDVLSPRYDFAEVWLNNQARGVYAYEEHFDKQLPEFHNRREGVIVRFSEDAFWQNIRREYEKYGKNIHNREFVKAFEGAQIRPFKAGKTLNTPHLARQFEIAQNLMLQYKNASTPPAQIFDLERLAKYYAIIDLAKAYHGVVWHNQRFYYNSITARLEPIGFDGYGAHMKNWRNRAFIGYGMFNPKHPDEGIHTALFKDAAFIEKYTTFLYKFSAKAYAEKLMLDLDADIDQRQVFLNREFSDYAYKKGEILANARKIRSIMLPFNTESLKAHLQSKEGGKQRLKIINHHCLPLQIRGFGATTNELANTLNASPLLPVQLKNALPEYTDMDAPANAKFVFFGMPGCDSVFHSPITPFPAPVPQSPSQQLFNKLQLGNNEVMEIHGKTVLMKAGTHQVQKNIIIPEGYEVRFEPDVQLNFTGGAGFVSRSPVFAYGTQDRPIKISSSDGTGKGFTVLQANQRSVLKHVLIENMNTFNFDGWTLTGALTFYESDVELVECAVTGNKCEDALNIIRSNFEINRILISHTFSDGFDADFCTGTIRNGRFMHTGNDGMDFSGSRISVEDCTVENAGDKGLSVGEQAFITVNKITINGAVIGLASKDLSELTVDELTLRNCQQGMAAYQKKPEFGGAQITIKKYQTENVKALHKIERGSTLKLEGTVFEGKL